MLIQELFPDLSLSYAMSNLSQHVLSLSMCHTNSLSNHPVPLSSDGLYPYKHAKTSR
jgi:hypothetical protein